MNKRYKYQEVAERIKMDIFVNHQPPSKPIPSISEYAKVNQVNPHTVVCALRLLMEKVIIMPIKEKVIVLLLILKM